MLLARKTTEVLGAARRQSGGVEQKSGLGAVHGLVLHVEALIRDLLKNTGAL